MSSIRPMSFENLFRIRPTTEQSKLFSVTPSFARGDLGYISAKFFLI